MTRGARRLRAGILVVALSTAACSREPRDWKAASAENSVPAYQRFLAAHPEGRHAVEARERIELQEFQAADWDPTPERRSRLEAFAERFPGGALAARARLAIEGIDFDRAMASGLLADLDAFLASHPSGARVDQARSRLEERLASRPPASRSLRRVRLRIDGKFTSEDYDVEKDESIEEPFEPDLDLAEAPSTWLRRAGLEAVTGEAPVQAELAIEATGTPISETYDFADADFPISRYEGAELSGRIRFEIPGAPRIERRFYGEIVPPERIEVTLQVFGDVKPLPFNEAHDAPFDRAAKLPGSLYERLLEVLCDALGPGTFREADGSPAPTWGWIEPARAGEILDRCARRAAGRA